MAAATSGAVTSAASDARPSPSGGPDPSVRATATSARSARRGPGSPPGGRAAARARSSRSLRPDPAPANRTRLEVRSRPRQAGWARKRSKEGASPRPSSSPTTLFGPRARTSSSSRSRRHVWKPTAASPAVVVTGAPASTRARRTNRASPSSHSPRTRGGGSAATAFARAARMFVAPPIATTEVPAARPARSSRRATAAWSLGPSTRTTTFLGALTPPPSQRDAARTNGFRIDRHHAQGRCGGAAARRVMGPWGRRDDRAGRAENLRRAVEGLAASGVLSYSGPL